MDLEYLEFFDHTGGGGALPSGQGKEIPKAPIKEKCIQKNGRKLYFS